MRKVLIAIPYLESGGVEVSLIRFLKEFAKDGKNSVDLLMLKKKGIYLKDVPDNVNILELKYDNPIYDYDNDKNYLKKISKLGDKIKFVLYRFKLKRFLKHNDWENYYKTILEHVEAIGGEYDLAIDWHGYGHFITSVVADKVIAKKKCFWIHDEKNDWLNKVNYWFPKFDRIFCVSLACKNNAMKNSPSLNERLDVFYNMTDYENVRRKSLEDMAFEYNDKQLNIVTVGRLEWQKAYDVAVLIAKKLKEKGVNFCWYVIGDGHKRLEIESLIKVNDVSDCFKLLGVIKNPFPYIKAADIYVLSSRHEGYCLATLEAKILGKVIIATNIESNREQISNYENGLLCELDPEEFADKIIEVYNDEKLMKKIENNLKNENFDYTDEFKKLYKLLEE